MMDPHSQYPHAPNLAEILQSLNAPLTNQTNAQAAASAAQPTIPTTQAQAFVPQPSSSIDHVGPSSSNIDSSDQVAQILSALATATASSAVSTAAAAVPSPPAVDASPDQILDDIATACYYKQATQHAQRRNLQSSHQNETSRAPPLDPTSITDWSQGLRCMAKVASQNPDLATKIQRVGYSHLEDQLDLTLGR